jgi:hypothetical protein
MGNILEPNDINYGESNDDDTSVLEHQRTRDLNKSSNNFWENKNLLLNEAALAKYVENYKKIERLDEFQQVSPVNRRDPIIAYLNKIKDKNHPPHKLPFKKPVCPVDDDVESVVS